MIDIKKTLHEAIAQLASIDSARLDAEILLAFVLNKNRTFLYTHPDKILTDREQQSFQKLIDQRILGLPIAYLTEIREFWSLPFHVNQDTLIPRPETERLVELALFYLKDNPNAFLADLGTGSGAIALAIASEKPRCRMIAIDKSEHALAIAQKNAQQLNIQNVEFYLSDWFENINQHSFDAIISNPPYIKACDPHLQMGDVRFEPQQALVGGVDGLKALREVIEQSYHRLVAHGFLLLEHGYHQKDEVIHLLQQQGFKKIQSWKDYEGNDRVSGGWLSE